MTATLFTIALFFALFFSKAQVLVKKNKAHAQMVNNMHAVVRQKIRSVKPLSHRPNRGRLKGAINYGNAKWTGLTE